MASSRLIFVVLLAAFGFACSEDAKAAPAAKPAATTATKAAASLWYNPYGLGLGYGYGGILPGYLGGAYSGYLGGALPGYLGGALPGYLGGYPGLATSSVTHHAPAYPFGGLTSSVTHHAPYGVGAGYLGGLYGGYLY